MVQKVEGELTVCVFAILGDVAEDGDGIASRVAEVVVELCGTLVAVGVGLEGVDDPDLA